MTYPIAILAGVVGAAVGWAAAAAAAILIGGLLGVSDFEGGRGMMAVWGIGPVGGLAGLVLGAVLALRLRGGGLGAMAWRLPLVLAGIALAGAGALWWMVATQPVLNPNGAAPRLVFEVRLPPGVSASARDVKVDLHTAKNRMPGELPPQDVRTEAGRSVLAGSVELYYRSGWRLLEVRVPGQLDRLFQLGLAASPGHAKDFGPWRRADFVAEPGLSQPRKADATEAFEIRYRVVWPGQD